MGIIQRYSEKVTWAITISLAIFLGVVFGKWVAFSDYPVSVLERLVISQNVAPGADLRVFIKLDRRAQCDVRVVRYFQFSDRSRVQIVQTYEAGFGPLGGDTFLLKTQVPQNAPRGEAFLWSQPQSVCNVLEYFFPRTGPISIDRFDVTGPIVDPLN